MSTLAGEVHNPSKTFPRALAGGDGYVRGASACIRWGRLGWLSHLAMASCLCVWGSTHRALLSPPLPAGAVLLVVASYLLPLLVGLGVSAGDKSQWQLGFFAVVAEKVRVRSGGGGEGGAASQLLTACSLCGAPQVGGKWLAWWIVAAAAISQIGQFEVGGWVGGSAGGVGDAALCRGGFVDLLAVTLPAEWLEWLLGLLAYRRLR